MLELIPVPYDNLEETRLVWVPLVTAVAKRQRCYPEQRLADIYKGDVALLLVWDTDRKKVRALIQYSILVRGRQKVFKLVSCTGQKHTGLGPADWTRLHSRVEDFAKGIGCAGMVALARPGWSPRLKGWGYKLMHVTYEKDFSEDFSDG